MGHGSKPLHGQQLNCDEYPFATTREGAGKAAGNHSTRLIDATDNQNAGRRLSSGYINNCIIDGDDFYITPAPRQPGESAGRAILGIPNGMPIISEVTRGAPTWRIDAPGSGTRHRPATASGRGKPVRASAAHSRTVSCSLASSAINDGAARAPAAASLRTCPVVP